MDSYVKYGFISNIFKNLEEKRPYYGKIVVQKIIYFLQEATNVNLDYNFSFYHYGPYSDELARDIQLMEMNNLINTSSDPQGRGYAIHLNEDETKELIEESNEFINSYLKEVDRVINDFGRFKPSPLELYATIHFVYKDINLENVKKTDKNEIVKIVKGLKPKFDENEISKSYDKLIDLHYIS